ncbi:hypothetical protein [Methylobacterium oxalidis]|uniref:hypothetical protein n=1 Tax=Methylobacterium oxalidis TaxID=944322 RepID=UPI00331629AD
MPRFAQGFLAAYILAGVYLGAVALAGPTSQGFGRSMMVGAAWPLLVSPAFVRREICAAR